MTQEDFEMVQKGFLLVDQNLAQVTRTLKAILDQMIYMNELLAGKRS
jgi:hypothetical protein